MKKQELLNLLNINDILMLPDALWGVIDGDIEYRHKIYRELIQLNGCDMSYDWFQSIYESEFSERKQKKQDFTPNELGVLCSLLTGAEGTVHEPTAGNGSMLIADWWQKCRKSLPFDFYPSRHMVCCWELSDRSIPILLVNLSIRGIMGEVYHGDVLTKEIKNKYILLNKSDDALAFSEIVRVPQNSKITRAL